MIEIRRTPPAVMLERQARVAAAMAEVERDMREILPIELNGG